MTIATPDFQNVLFIPLLSKRQVHVNCQDWSHASEANIPEIIEKIEQRCHAPAVGGKAESPRKIVKKNKLAHFGLQIWEVIE